MKTPEKKLIRTSSELSLDVYNELLSDQENAWVIILPGQVSESQVRYRAVIAVKAGEEGEAVLVQVFSNGEKSGKILGKITFDRSRESGNPICILYFSPKLFTELDSLEPIEIRRWEF